jgi:hypothetical protein
VATRSGPTRKEVRAHARRDTLHDLRLVQDTDGFLELALLRLELLFEWDPFRRQLLQAQERTLEEVEGMDWPRPPAGRAGQNPPVDLAAVVRYTEELSAGDV